MTAAMGYQEMAEVLGVTSQAAQQQTERIIRRLWNKPIKALIKARNVRDSRIENGLSQ